MVDERIYLTKNKLKEIEADMRFRRHLDRYFMIRQFCYGVVIDAACGCGYGSHIISQNPDVTSVLGVDIDPEAVQYAHYQYQNDKVAFICSEIGTLHPPKADILVSIETIEHLANPQDLYELARKAEVHTVIVSFPAKVSTTYNPFHKFDFDQVDITQIFKDYSPRQNIFENNELIIMHLSKFTTTTVGSAQPTAPKRWRTCK